MMRKKYIQPLSENVILTLKGSVTTDDIGVNNKSGDPWTFTNDIDFEEDTPPPAPVTKSLWD
ncbi:MAG: hypothetical protein II755_04445 [Prevotella sp.]|nr:hypothetical protein [Prevotella sp.]